MDKGGFAIGDIDADSVLQTVDLAVALKDIEMPTQHDYADTNTVAKVVKIIQGYTDIINEWVRRKNL